MNRQGRLLRYPFAVASRLRCIEWKAYNWKKRCRLKNTDFSIISSNCNGTFIY
ncbi:MAG: DUF1919 domain-containing protein [Provencibacterium sp.]|jgi:hypothetical protein|nr:DUF1919 domain-containing protein [Provencibacterium sp.]